MNFANTPSFANQGLQPGGRLFLCVLTSLALLIGDSQYGLMEKARDAISVVLYPLQRAANVPLNLTMQVGDFFTAQAALKRENDALRERDLIQSSHLMRMSSLEKELQQLRQLNALAAQPSHAGVVAEVLYTGRDPFSYRLIIDKGSSSGIASGQAVIDENGLIGQVTRVQPLSAEVTQVINRHYIVPVMIERTGHRALLYGFGGGVEVRYLPISTDIRENDLLVTSGVDGVYLQGIPVARVKQIDRLGGAAFARVRSEVIAGVQSSRFVVIMPNRRLPATPPVLPPADATKTDRKSP